MGHELHESRSEVLELLGVTTVKTRQNVSGRMDRSSPIVMTLVDGQLIYIGISSGTSGRGHGQ